MAAFKIEDRPYASAEIELNGTEYRIGIKSPGVKFTTAMADFSDEFEIFQKMEKLQNSKDESEFNIREYSRQAAKVLTLSQEVILSMVLEKDILARLFESREWSIGEVQALLSYFMDCMNKVTASKKNSPALTTDKKRRKKSS